MGFFYVPNGTYLPNFHPVGVGSRTSSSRRCSSRSSRCATTSWSSAAWRTRAPRTLSEGGGVHTRVGAAWLSGVRPKKTEGADIEAGTSIDQMAAAVIGAGHAAQLAAARARLRLRRRQLRERLQLRLPANVLLEGADDADADGEQSARGLRAAVRRRRHARPSAARGCGRTAASSTSAIEDMARLQQRARRRRSTDGRRIPRPRCATSSSAFSAPSSRPRRSRCPRSEQPVGIPDQFDDHAQLMLDLILLAYPGRRHARRRVPDLTRAERTGLSVDWRARRPSRVSHHQLDPEKIAKATKINAYHMSLFALPAREDEEHAGRRRHAARSLDHDVRRGHGRQRPPHAGRTCR